MSRLDVIMYNLILEYVIGQTIEVVKSLGGGNYKITLGNGIFLNVGLTFSEDN